MVILKKIKAATLMETLVATTIIVIIFMLASFTMNNLFSKRIKNNTRNIESHLNELKYQLKNEQFVLPYIETYKDWDINIQKPNANTPAKIELEATNLKTKKIITDVFYE